MKTRAVLLIMAINAFCFSAFGQEGAMVLPAQPHLFHIWSDANGDTHIQEIKLANNKRAMISGLTMNFSGTPAGPNAKKLHNTPARQFAITVSGKIDVEASDGSRAHLDVGDMAFLEDTTGKGHKTFEEGAASVFLRVPELFDVNAWARGN